MKKKQNLAQKQEILWNIINSLLAGALVLLGSLADGEFSIKGAGIALLAALIVAVTKFKEYWTTQEKEYKCVKIFQFIH